MVTDSNRKSFVGIYVFMWSLTQLGDHLSANTVMLMQSLRVLGNRLLANTSDIPVVTNRNRRSSVGEHVVVMQSQTEVGNRLLINTFPGDNEQHFCLPLAACM